MSGRNLKLEKRAVPVEEQPVQQKHTKVTVIKKILPRQEADEPLKEKPQDDIVTKESDPETGKLCPIPVKVQ